MKKELKHFYVNTVNNKIILLEDIIFGNNLGYLILENKKMNIALIEYLKYY
jgi:hypothetical protein